MTDYNIVKMNNEMELTFLAYSANEAMARISVASFVASKNPTLEELSDIKTAVSEAVTNCIIHGYDHNEEVLSRDEKVYLRCKLEDNLLTIEVEDKGVGIENIEQAMEPLYTSKPDMERSGMGFAFMEAFMDELEVSSVPGEGTLIRMRKEIGNPIWIGED